jgi:hypothetical protein
LAKAVDELRHLREALGIDEEKVNTIDEEEARTAFWTLSDLVTDLQRSWQQIRHPRG